MKLDLFIEPYTKNNSKEIEDFNICPKTIKFLEENTGSMLLDMSLSNISSDMSLLTRETKQNFFKIRLH